MCLLTMISGGLALKLVSSMAEVNDQSTIIAENWLPSLAAVSELNTELSDFRLAQAKHAGTTDQATMQEAERDIESLAKNIETLRAEYEPLISSDEEKTIYQKFSDNWGPYL